LLDVAGRAPHGATRVVVYEGADASDRLAAAPGPVWLVVGPEGGFAAEEIAALGAIGYRTASLGPTTLRVETAAPVAVAVALSLARS
jgi:16S rRNA (uracil1498-N3)-methyltransferase